MENDSQWYDDFIKQMETQDLIGTIYDPNYYEDEKAETEETETEIKINTNEDNDGNF